MPTYAIGDVQGCKDQLEHLLEVIHFDPTVDTLWFAGDLVNRGPDSLGTLQLIYSLRKSVEVVLGNHDLHLLAVSEHPSKQNSKDTFDDVLEAVDRTKLLLWLRHQPLVHVEGDFLMTHAGVYPLWDRNEVVAYAEEVEQVLASDQYSEFLLQMYGNQPDKFSTTLTGMDRLRFITNTFTRMRFCTDDMALDMLCKKPIEDAPDELIPWFNVNNRIDHRGTILHGHWAALLGGEPKPGIISLDTGCVWGNKLSAWRLEDKQWFSVPGYQAK